MTSLTWNKDADLGDFGGYRCEEHDGYLIRRTQGGRFVLTGYSPGQGGEVELCKGALKVCQGFALDQYNAATATIADELALTDPIGPQEPVCDDVESESAHGCGSGMHGPAPTDAENAAASKQPAEEWYPMPSVDQRTTSTIIDYTGSQPVYATPKGFRLGSKGKVYAPATFLKMHGKGDGRRLRKSARAAGFFGHAAAR